MRDAIFDATQMLLSDALTTLNKSTDPAVETKVKLQTDTCKCSQSRLACAGMRGQQLRTTARNASSALLRTCKDVP